MFYAGIYQPSQIKGIKSEIKKFVGKEIPLQYGWRATDGQDRGQHYYTAAPFINYVPESDLKDLVNISRIKYEEMRQEIMDVL